jgi:hypothetical protein
MTRPKMNGIRLGFKDNREKKMATLANRLRQIGKLFRKHQIVAVDQLRLSRIAKTFIDLGTRRTENTRRFGRAVVGQSSSNFNTLRIYAQH